MTLPSTLSNRIFLRRCAFSLLYLGGFTRRLTPYFLISSAAKKGLWRNLASVPPTAFFFGFFFSLTGIIEEKKKRAVLQCRLRVPSKRH